MNRRRVGIAAIAIVSILLVTGFILGSPLLHPGYSGFEWGVEVGDTFQFEVRTIGSTAGGRYAASEIHTLNETTIEATIDELPQVNGTLDTITFVLDIVLLMKVSCTFTNGSSIPYQLDDILCVGVRLEQKLDIGRDFIAIADVSCCFHEPDSPLPAR